MATLTIRELDDSAEAQLRVRAAEHGRSMEEEAREILASALAVRRSPAGAVSMAERIRRRFEPVGGVELQIRDRLADRDPVDFSGPEYGVYDDE